MSLRAIVKQVISGDSLVLRGKTAEAAERVLNLAFITSPRGEEAWALQAKDFLRTLTVGKEGAFTISHTSSTGASEFGDLAVKIPGKDEDVDVALRVVEEGWAKVRESRSNEDEGGAEAQRKQQLREAEEQAKAAGKGIWSPEPAPSINVSWSMPADLDAFMQQYRGQSLDAVIEAVNNGTAVKARLILSPESHQVVTVAMAGIRSPRAAGNNPSENQNNCEPFGNEAKQFSEARLLQRNIKVVLLSLPPASIGNSNTPSFIIGQVNHPAGSIAQLLVNGGFARCIDAHAAFLGVEGMSTLRKGEKEAKDARRGIWKDLPIAPSATNGVNGHHANGALAPAHAKKFEAVVIRIYNSESIGVKPGKTGTGEERRIFFSSTRQPKASETKLAGLQNEGKEFLRKKLIGKVVSVTIDYIQPKQDQYEAKECATIKTSNGQNVAELVIEKGYATAIRHRHDDENKSSEIDALMAAEAKANTASVGLHSGKDFPAPRISDISETAARANSFLNTFKRSGKMPVVVDYVASGSRFKVYLPRENSKLTLVLSGIRAPRTARNANEKADPYGKEASEWMTSKAFQRDAEIEVDGCDKSGGFLGTLYINKENMAVELVREGLAKVDDYATSKDLRNAEDAAKREKKNIWANYDASAEEEQAAATAARNGPIAARSEYVDIVISDIRTNPFSMAVQILKQDSVPELEKLMSDFSLHHKTAASTSFVPKVGDQVSAKFTFDNVWYRAKVRRANPAKKQAEVYFYDYGNSEILGFDRLRPLDAKFKTLGPQAQEAKLSFVELLGNETEYGEDALDLFRHLCENKRLVANIDNREASGTLSLTLYEPGASTAESAINVDLVREGLARIVRRSPLREAYPNIVKALDEAQKEAKKTRAGAYQYGDILED